MKHTTTTPTPAADWRKFAAAGTATLAAVTHADAAIIYVDPTVKPTAAVGGPTRAPFAIDGVAVQIRNFTGSNPYAGKYEVAKFDGLPLWYHRSGGSFFNFAANYQRGASVGAQNQHTGNGQPISVLVNNAVFRVKYPNRSGSAEANFSTGKTGFAGFKLPASKGGGEGWLRIEITDPAGTGGPSGLTVLDWAYNDAGGGITAGQGIPSAVPEPGTDKALALLALGSAGVLAWRKRRAAARA